MTKRGITIYIDAVPDTETTVFRSEAADAVLRVLVDAHETEFPITELADATGVARSTVWRAVELLDSMGAIRVRETPQRNYVAIDPDQLHKDDPVLAIDQSAFHDPVRAFVEAFTSAITATDDVASVVGIVVFGSVARGEADRQSDIDLFVDVDGDRTTARRVATDLVGDLGERRFDGDRYDFEPYMESTDSARRAGAKLRDVFEEGVTVYDGDRLQEIRKEVFADE